MKTYQLLGINTAIHLLRSGVASTTGTTNTGGAGGSGIVILRVNYT